MCSCVHKSHMWHCHYGHLTPAGDPACEDRCKARASDQGRAARPNRHGLYGTIGEGALPMTHRLSSSASSAALAAPCMGTKTNEVGHINRGASQCFSARDWSKRGLG